MTYGHIKHRFAGVIPLADPPNPPNPPTKSVSTPPTPLDHPVACHLSDNLYLPIPHKSLHEAGVIHFQCPIYFTTIKIFTIYKISLNAQQYSEFFFLRLFDII